MDNRSSISLIATAVLVSALAGAATAQTQKWTQVGMLNCTLAPAVGLIVVEKQRMTCQFKPSQPAAPPQNYTGVMTTVGIDIGATAGGKLAWAVLAPTKGPPAGALAGNYGGASGEIALGIGAGANVLVGGSNRSIALQPVSVEGTLGLDIQLGVSGLELTAAP